MELLLMALAPFILFALIFDRFDFAGAGSDDRDPQASGQDSVRRSDQPVAGLRRTGAPSRRDRASRPHGAATWN